MLVDEHGTFVEQLGIRGVPTNILVDDHGTVTCVGASTPPELEAAVQRLLGPGTTIEPGAGTDDWSWDKDPEHIGTHLAKRIVDPKG